MVEATFQVQVPASLLRYGLDKNEVQHRITEWPVLSLFTDEHVSSGKAARLLGTSRIEFLALLCRRGIAYIDYTPDELEQEFAAVRELESELSQ